MSKHAYLIMAHTDIALLRVLIGMLDYEKNDIFLHIDKKWQDFRAEDLEVEKSKLYILPRRIDGAWGHSSLVDIELLLFETAFKRGEYDYFHLLSGADLPIKSQAYIHNFFDKHKGKEFISFWTSESAIADARYKVERYHYGMRWEKKPLPRLLSILCAKSRILISNTLFFLFGARKFPWQIAKGANWVSLTKKIVEKILLEQESIGKALSHTRNGEEIFIQSIIASTSDLKNKVYSWESNDSAAMRTTIWETGANSPKTFTIEDKDFLLNSPNLFARKFSSSVDMGIIRLIESKFKN